MSAAAGLLALALLVWPPLRPASDRLGGPAVSPPTSDPAGPRRRWVVAVVAGGAAVTITGPGPVGLLVAAAVVVAVERWLRRAGPRPEDQERRVRTDLPVAADLLAVCLAGGSTVVGAVAAVGGAVGGPLGAVLVDVAARLRWGTAPRTAWIDVPDAALALARVVVRAGESGSAVVPALQRLAADSRIAERAETAAAVQRAAVWVLAPLGLCFLPAFLCLGVAPLVLGIAADVFG